MLQNELLSEVSSGKINSADQDALSAALDTIDAAMQADRPAVGGGKPPSPEEMKAKIDGLIQGQVDSGALTSEQADELKSVFGNAMPPAGDPVVLADLADLAVGTAPTASAAPVRRTIPTVRTMLPI
jgi:hypothetical protein